MQMIGEEPERRCLGCGRTALVMHVRCSRCVVGDEDDETTMTTTIRLMGSHVSSLRPCRPRLCLPWQSRCASPVVASRVMAAVVRVLESDPRVALQRVDVTSRQMHVWLARVVVVLVHPRRWESWGVTCVCRGDLNATEKWGSLLCHLDYNRVGIGMKHVEEMKETTYGPRGVAIYVVQANTSSTSSCLVAVG